MAEDAATPETSAAEVAAEEVVDYKAEAEKWRERAKTWEKRSKENKAAADAAPSADDLQAARDALAAAEAERDAFRAQADYSAAVSEVAAATGLSETVVRALKGTTVEELTASAGLLKSHASVYPQTRDAGEVKADAPTRESIMAIKDRNKRMDAIAANPELFRQ